MWLILRRSGLKALPWLPSALLMGVALNQVYLANTTHLSAWKGGGFGMFSTTDGGPNRRVRVFVQGPGLDREVPVPEHLDDLARRTSALPVDGNLARLARQIARATGNPWGDVRTVRVEVWRIEFDGVDLEPTPRRLHTFRLEVTRGDP